VFTTRPDTLFGATYMVLAPEHPLIDRIVPETWPERTKDVWTAGQPAPAPAVAAYQKAASRRSDQDRQGAKTKSGVFTGAFATNPVNDARIPIFVADYVLMGYGSGAIMGVPGQDERDWEFAEVFELDIIRTVQPPDGFDGKAFIGEGPAINSGFLNGMGVAESKSAMIAHLTEIGAGEGTVTTKMRDWLFARQRYWGEPIPVVYGDTGHALAVPETELPVRLPELIDWAPAPWTKTPTPSLRWAGQPSGAPLPTIWATVSPSTVAT
jgi:leucyl-tRNA synthetase